MRANRFRDFLWRHAPAIGFVVMVLFVAGVGFVGYTYVVVTRKFDSSRLWDLPSRVYSDSTPLVPGLAYPRSLLEPKLNHVGYYEVKRKIANPGEYRFVDGDLEIYLQDFEYPDIDFHGLPVRIEMEERVVNRIVRLDDDVELRAVRIEPELITSIYDDVMEDRLPVPLSAVPQHLIDAITVTEDRTFFTHEGISMRGILRAIATDVRRGSLSAGGSTLTQQLIKNLYLTSERTFSRKALEALMALLLEARYSKEEILEAYLNEIYLGQNGSVQMAGVEQAAQVYFGKRVTNISVAEAATIAGMIRSPNLLAPTRYPERSRDRRDVVLKGMLEQGKITEEQYADAISSPLTSNKYPRGTKSAPFFVDLVLKQLRERYPETQLRTEGLRIFTTLDMMTQRSAERALDAGVASLTKRYSHIRKSPTPLEGVVLTVQPGTGYVKALVGGRSYSKSQFNRAFQARRQPGSLFKPFVYAAGMSPQRGRDALTASSVLDDSPIAIQSGSNVWRPQNYDGRFHGNTSLRRALALSYNIPAVRATMSTGVPNVIRTASQMGVQSNLQPYPSISLGSFEVSPLEIAYAYAVFANGGVKAEPISILAVVTREGKILENREVEMRRVAPAGVCYVINDILKDVLRYGTAGRARSLGFSRPFAGKTGTTNNYRDAWFVGYSPRILTLVWVGFDDGHNVRLTGGDAALPIWTAHMNRIGGVIPDVDFKRPEDVMDAEIDPSTGMLAGPDCPASRSELFVAGTDPETVCTVHSDGGDDSLFPLFDEQLDDSEGVPSQIADGEAGEGASPEQTEEVRRKRRERGLKGWFKKVFD